MICAGCALGIHRHLDYLQEATPERIAHMPLDELFDVADCKVTSADGTEQCECPLTQDIRVLQMELFHRTFAGYA